VIELIFLYPRKKQTKNLLPFSSLPPKAFGIVFHQSAFLEGISLTILTDSALMDTLGHMVPYIPVGEHHYD